VFLICGPEAKQLLALCGESKAGTCREATVRRGSGYLARTVCNSHEHT